MISNKAFWEKGDFSRIAESMRGGGETLAASFGITKGLKILDLGCGDGTTALPVAQRGADVLGIDISSNIVEAGNRRARELGLTIPLVVRLEGTNVDKGKAILRESGLNIIPADNLADAAAKVVRAVKAEAA